jgi:hypothetical protein
MAVDKSADLGGNIRASEMNEEARNVGIINDFAERTNKNYQNWLNVKADQISQARLANLNRDQAIADANVGLTNKTKVDNINRWNDLQGRQFDARRANRQDRIDVKKDKDRAKQQVYENLMAKARGSAGIAQTGIDYLRSDARDKNQAIRGVGDTITSGAMYYGANAKPTTESAPMGSATVRRSAFYSPNSSVHPLDENQSRIGISDYESPYDYDDYYRGR